jgi:hemolysin III
LTAFLTEPTGPVYHEAGTLVPTLAGPGYRWFMAGNAQELGEQLVDVLAEVKPRLRGWLHAVTSPLTLAAGVVLVALSPTATARIGSIVFTATALLLFTVSAVYHRGSWSPPVRTFLRRFDHANIFLLIAGSYTPFTLLLLHGRSRIVLLGIVWGGAVLGMASRVLWVDSPRWLHVPIYVALGWAAVFYADEFAHGGGPLVLALVVTGGLLYTLGGVVYGLRRPDPFPSWFGFHEVFHSLTIAAFITHYVGVSVATYSLR